MLQLYLIRHGQKQHTRFDPALTELGHQQAQKTGSFLRQLPIQKIIASPRKRTQQTAEHISEHTKVEIVTDDRLAERMDFSAADQSVDMETFSREWLRATQDRLFKPRWGSSSMSVSERVLSLVKELEAQNLEHVVLVSHGGTIADFLRSSVGESAVAPLWSAFPLGLDVRITECSISHIAKNSDGFEAVALHQTQHLA